MENSKLDKLFLKLKSYASEHEDILKLADGLSTDKLLTDLKEAMKYHKGYYANSRSVFIYVKGIEMTNDVADLCRMGFNGEDRGIWIHYCIIDGRSVSYVDVPISSFVVNYFDRRYCKKDELMHPITKEEFEGKVRDTINVICSDYEKAIDVNECYKVIKKFEELWHKCVYAVSEGL